jgi:exodeoxyribonuclease VIII
VSDKSQPQSPEVELNRLLDLPEDVYNTDQTAVRKTWLDYIERSPAHLQAYRAGLVEPTEAMIFGQFIHAFLLEPHVVGGRFYREPEGAGHERNTKAFKAACIEAAELNPGKQVIRAERYDLAVKIRDSVWTHRAARKILEYEGEGFEKSMFWKNEPTSELCKAKFDKVTVKGAFIADLKTAEDASPTGFGKSMVNYRYPVQVAQYTEPLDLRFLFIVVEKKPPFAVACYAAGDDVIRIGQRDRLHNLRTYAECRARDEWPAYPDVIMRAQLPRWAR